MAAGRPVAQDRESTTWDENDQTLHSVHSSRPYGRLWRAADERQEFGLGIGVAADLYSGSVVSALSKYVVHWQHAFEHLGASDRVKGFV